MQHVDTPGSGALSGTDTQTRDAVTKQIPWVTFPRYNVVRIMGGNMQSNNAAVTLAATISGWDAGAA